MSKVKIEGNASGTGTLTISAPNTNTDRSLTLPDGAGEILLANGDGSGLTGVGNTGSAFKVMLNADQTISHWTETTLQFDTKTYDVNSEFDTSTYRFTPTQEGYYWITLQVEWDGSTDYHYELQNRLRINGSVVKTTKGSLNFSYGNTGIVQSDIFYFNGTTDYLDAAAKQYDYSANSTVIVLDDTTTLSGFFVRSA